MEYRSVISEAVDINKNVALEQTFPFEWPERHWRQESQDACGSLERQLLYEDYLNKPEWNSPKEVNKSREVFTLGDAQLVKGEDIPDVPTSYVISGIQPHELPVIGTYVDRRIAPGYRYRVRLQHTNNYLFNRAALCLKTIGMGYGKRLTFHGGSLNRNKAYFWSDSYADGYCFSLEVIRPGDEFLVAGTEKQFVITKCEPAQIEIGNEQTTNVGYTKKVLVKFCMKNDEDEELYCEGVASVGKTSKGLMARVDKIICESYSLIPARKPVTTAWEKYE